MPVEVDVLARPESVAVMRARVAGLGQSDADRLADRAGGSALGDNAGGRVHGRDWHARPRVPAAAGDPGGPAAGPWHSGDLSAVARRRDPAHRGKARSRRSRDRRAGRAVRVPGSRTDPREPVHCQYQQATWRPGSQGRRSARLAAEPRSTDPQVAGQGGPQGPGDAQADPGHSPGPSHPRAGGCCPRPYRGDPGRKQPSRPAQSEGLAQLGPVDTAPTGRRPCWYRQPWPTKDGL
jgi:hypothetical protein